MCSSTSSCFSWQLKRVKSESEIDRDSESKLLKNVLDNSVTELNSQIKLNAAIVHMKMLTVWGVVKDKSSIIAKLMTG